MKATVLESDRLIFKPLDTSYSSQRYVDWMNDFEVFKYLESGGDYTLEKLNQYLSDVENKSILFWAINVGDKHIGNIKIDPINWKNKVGELGIMIGDKSEWGKGYSKEAIETIVQYCFSSQVNLRKVTLGVIEDNEAALKLYKKLQFEIEGVYKLHALHDGKWCNNIRMARFNPICYEHK
ncbi:MAG: GNAT family protein [Reichenbachiella sp.]|uniref:GNAT family N-acetyltransferase n=1 Tax=Reichenbachiella sp. TaxID=2184521 RepID=UPI00326534CD